MSEEKVEKITPYDGEEAKTGQVRRMFDSIAPADDTMNRLMTLGIDRRWRRKTVAEAVSGNPEAILDIATGTGDLAIALARAAEGATVTGVDLSEGMIEVGRRKVAEAGLSDRVKLSPADALALPFADNSFDVITVAFGVRNFEHLAEGYAEMLRVLRPGGRLVILELSLPEQKLIRGLFKLYFLHILPLIGGLISGNRGAYRYLPESVLRFPPKDIFLNMLTSAGFVNVGHKALTFGICRMYWGEKA